MWEYMRCKRNDIDELLADCEALGDKGWELVNVTYVAGSVDVTDGYGGSYGGSYVAVLKRKKKG